VDRPQTDIQYPIIPPTCPALIGGAFSLLGRLATWPPTPVPDSAPRASSIACAGVAVIALLMAGLVGFSLHGRPVPCVARLQNAGAPVAAGASFDQTNIFHQTRFVVHHAVIITQAEDQMYNSDLKNWTTVRAQGTAEQLFRLGMMCSTGRSMPLDIIAAHQWFNIAAALGMKDAARLRNEVAAEMSEREIALAQRAAREWLVRH
jgi:uncharacterized protein